MTKKFYVVWKGRKTGIFDSWDECKAQVDGFAEAKYKGFPTITAAEAAFKAGFQGFKEAPAAYQNSLNLAEGSPRPIENAIAVDAACAGNPGKMEYRGVFVATGTEVFKSPVFENGTNNIGEFLAIVHCLAWQQKNNLNYPIYSDSLNGQKWVREGVCKTKLTPSKCNAVIFNLIQRAENWLKNNDFRVPIYKWRTELWGEIPADFGRKS